MTRILSWIGVLFLDYGRKVAQFSVLIGVNAFVIGVAITYFLALIKLIIWLYDEINYVLSFVNRGFENASLKLFFDILQASGVWNGFVDAFAILSLGLLSLFILFLSKIGLKALMHLRNSVFILLVGSK